YIIFTRAPIIFAAKTWAPFSDPGSAVPRIREPITKSASPRSIGPTNRGIALTSSEPSPSRNTSTSLVFIAALAPAAHAAPYPRGAFTTFAPAALAFSAVPSVLPLSTTMHSAISPHGIERTTLPIEASSFSAGITTETLLGICCSSAIKPAVQPPLPPHDLHHKRTQHREINPAIQHKHPGSGHCPFCREAIEECADISQRHPVRI